MALRHILAPVALSVRSRAVHRTVANGLQRPRRGVASVMPLRTLYIVLTVTVAAIAVVLGRQATPPSAVRVRRVTSTADDGSSRTLRWAITTSNASAELERIEHRPAERAGRIITLRTPLPPIKSPVQIEGTAWKRSGDYVVIDGSGDVPPGGPQSCPGATPGQYGANVRTTTFPGLRLIDTADVEPAGV
jgi:3-dehydroshikimate dehydratase